MPLTFQGMGIYTSKDMDKTPSPAGGRGLG